MIGVPPYSPGDYLDVDDDGEFVTIRLADQFSRPLRLTPAEGLALLAAGRTLLAVPGSDPEGPLATALAKLERALDLPEVACRSGSRPILEAVRDAADARRARRDRLLVGRPRRAHDPPHRSRGRVLRDGRVVRERVLPPGQRRADVPRRPHPRACARPASTSRPASGDDEIAEVFHPHADDPRVTLELAPSAAWVAEAYPAESTTTRPDGTIEVVLAVSEPAWLERLLVRLGPEARVLAARRRPAGGRRRRPHGCSRATTRAELDRPTDRPIRRRSPAHVARPAP